MKKLLLVLTILLASTICHADETGGANWNDSELAALLDAKGGHTHNFTLPDIQKDYDLGVKVDAPNLIELTENWNFGVEGGKDLFQTSGKEGYFAYAKFTYNGTLLSLKK